MGRRAVVTLVSSTSTSSMGTKSVAFGFILLVLIDLGLTLIDLIKITVEMSFSSPFVVTSTVVFGLDPVFVNNKFGRSVQIVEDCTPPPAKVLILTGQLVPIGIKSSVRASTRTRVRTLLS